MNKYSPLQLLLWLIFFLFPIGVKAQISPDSTLGIENSVVIPVNKTNDRIDGGATRGANLFHSFQEFNIGEGRAVYFSNPVGIENILTRITGENKSDILGKLGVLGSANLFLINPHGFLFGKNSSLDIQGSFIASTADGIKLGETGFFNAINPYESQLLSIQPGALFTNSLRSYQANINNQGNLAVNSEKSLILSADTIINSGKLIAPAGQIFVLGNNINLIEKAEINVSSPTGGGTVLIGGSFQGGDNIPTAKNTYIAPGVTIKADAFNSGNGGIIVVWADQNTDFYGSISAQGGLNYGNGGLVEVSAKNNLKFRGNVNTNATNGLVGTLLLDPTNIIIANGSAAINDDQVDDGEILGNEGSNTFTISEQKLEQLSGDTNVILQATNDITLQNLKDNFLDFSSGKGIIEFIADSDRNGIGNFIMEDPQDTIRTNGRNISITGANLILGSISTNFLAGNITKSINVDTGGGIADGQGTLENSIPISTNFAFTVANLEKIADLDIIFSATFHEYVSDLSVILQSPKGTKINLFGFVGNDGANFQDPRLNDQATASINNANAPFIGEFQPAENLSKFNGENPNGKWTLIVTDNYPNYTGTLLKSGDNAPWGNSVGTQLIINSQSTQGDSGSIKLNATNGNINALSLDTSSTSGKAGNILLNATKEISIADQIETFHTNENGGSVTLQANGNVNLNSSLNTSGGITNNGLSNGGSVLIKSENGKLNLNNIDARGVNIGGNVILQANDQIKLNASIQTNGINNKSGDININTNSDILLNPGVEIAALSSRGLGGNVSLISQGNIAMVDGGISTDSGTLTPGTKGGSINIQAKNFSAKNTAQIKTFTDGAAQAGDIKITAEEILIDNSLVSSIVPQSATGNGGNIEFTANKISLLNNAQLDASSEGKGNAGDITIKTQEFYLKNNARISAFSQATLSGDITIDNLETLQIDNSNIFASTVNGKAGNIDINASKSVILAGKQGIGVEAKNQGSAGNITINTPEFSVSNDAVVSAANVNGKSGNINITANTFTATNGGQIITTTSGSSKAGNITLNVLKNINLAGENSGLFANTTASSSGDSGNINIDPQTMIIRDGAAVAVNSQGSGQGGNIDIQAGSLFLDNNGFINAETASNQGGNINLRVGDFLLLRRNSRITATAGTENAGGDGGNININTPFIIAFPNENSDITANAFSGNGGNINIITNTIFGLEFRPQETKFSDITASSEFGLSGEVIINRLDIDPTSGLVSILQNLLNTSNQIVQGCTGGGKSERQKNTFTIVGRDGIPSHPYDLLTGTTPLVDLVDVFASEENSRIQEIPPVVINNQSRKITHRVIQQAQGWIISSDGKVNLTTEVPQVTLQNSALDYRGCRNN